MRFSDAFGLRQGECVAVVGCGGKTALIERLADENREWSVLIAPTTRIALEQARERPGVRYLGVPSGGKLGAAPLSEIESASRPAGLTLMEADGSGRLPLKGWAECEPVVPRFATLTIGVVSARALGLPATGEHAHRLALFLSQAGCAEGDAVDAPALARMILWCMDRHAVGRRAVFINQADDPARLDDARRVAGALSGFDGTILIGSAKAGVIWNET